MDCTLIGVRAFVRDGDAAVRFYSETLGWAQLATGQGQLAIERYSDEGAGSPRRK